jgi:hypothetical protein
MQACEHNLFFYETDWSVFEFACIFAAKITVGYKIIKPCLLLILRLIIFLGKNKVIWHGN